MKKINLIGKLPIILLFFIWLYWMNLLWSQFNWNVVAMFKQRDDLYWRAFMVISIACSLYPLSFLRDNKNQEEEAPDKQAATKEGDFYEK